MLMVKQSEEEDAGDGITSRLNVPRLSLLGLCIHFDADEGACQDRFQKQGTEIELQWQI